MKISRLALLALLGGALMAFGCSDDTSDTGGTAGTGGGGGEGGMGGGGVPSCETTACLFCPEAALGGFGALIGDLNVPIDFTAVPDGAAVQGGTVMIDISATSTINDLPATITATVTDASTTTYEATTGGVGELVIPIPEQTVMGTDLNLDGGSGTAEFTVDADATALVIQLTSALIDLDVTVPVPLTLTLDASDTGDCAMLGDGVTIPVDPAM
ncbi:MAG: hypothetical protein WBN30_01340 [Polyangiales bacterium]